MRHALALVVLVGLAGCAGEYSKVPEPTGEWVPANPVSLTAQAMPPRPVVRQAVWRRRWIRPARPAVIPSAPAAPATAPSDKVAAR